MVGSLPACCARPANGQRKESATVAPPSNVEEKEVEDGGSRQGCVSDVAHAHAGDDQHHRGDGDTY